MIKIWEKYFFSEFAKTFCLFLFGFYGLYVLIDYSNHASAFQSTHLLFKWQEILSYYGNDFVQRMEVLIPFALLISTIKVLCGLNAHNELVALMANGVSLKRLLLPFILIGLFFTAVMYINTEFTLPYALREIKLISETKMKQKNRSSQPFAVQHLTLEDQSVIIFQRYDTANQSLYDAYWIRSIDEIYRINRLYLGEENSFGKKVDHFLRSEDGNLIIVASDVEKQFPSIKFNKQALFDTLTSPDELPFSDLWAKLPPNGEVHSEKQSSILANFYYKLGMPWLCLLAILGPAPFCVRFSRTFPIFFIYACAIFSLVGFYLLIDASTLLGKRQVIPPFYAVWTPFLIVGGWIGWKFYRL